MPSLFLLLNAPTFRRTQRSNPRAHVARNGKAIEAITAETSQCWYWKICTGATTQPDLISPRLPTGSARLILIGTYRPVEVILGDHPSKR
jgi:hypothetical protein